MSPRLLHPHSRQARLRWLPGLQLLRHYPAGWWRHDLAAGLVLTTMLVPVGIAYAVASGVPGIHGLYATIVALLAYALFGPSRILVMGPDSSLAALILAVVLPLSAGDPARAVALAGAMAIAVGLICIGAGGRIGWRSQAGAISSGLFATQQQRRRCERCARQGSDLVRSGAATPECGRWRSTQHATVGAAPDQRRRKPSAITALTTSSAPITWIAEIDWPSSSQAMARPPPVRRSGSANCRPRPAWAAA